MDISGLRIGVLHSLIGKNDGVSIVIDQGIKTMVEIMGIPLGHIYFLAGHSPPRLNTQLDDIFWHRNEQNKYILEHFSKEPKDDLDAYILEHTNYAKQILAHFIEDNNLDVFIIHNGCHPSNFIFSVAAGMYFEERRKEGLALPRYLLWWHDSHFERKRFKGPNAVIEKYLKYIPGKHVDGIVFINSQQAALAGRYLENLGIDNIEIFKDKKTCTIPNTCDIPWKWQEMDSKDQALAPPVDQYNKTFLKDVGLIQHIEDEGFSIEDTIILLQHTRVVERKRIDHAIEFAYQLEKTFTNKGQKKFIMLLISGHSGDEHDSHRSFLEDYFKKKQKDNPDQKVGMLFGEHLIFPAREVLVDKKFYAFSDIPGIAAAHGGMGTYFSEVEGYGNNLLEMMAAGLPVIINEYEIYKSDIEELGFRLVITREGKVSDEHLEDCYRLLTDTDYRNETIKHNLEVLSNKLDHKVMAEKLAPLIENMFKYL